MRVVKNIRRKDDNLPLDLKNRSAFGIFFFRGDLFIALNSANLMTQALLDNYGLKRKLIDYRSDFYPFEVMIYGF